MRTPLFVALALLLGSSWLNADGGAPINTSIKALAGAYGGSYGMAQIRGEGVSFGPDGSVSFKLPMGMNARGFASGKITYFSTAGFVVKFVGKQDFAMKFAFQKGYPKSFFRDDGKAGVSVFTRL